MFNRILGAAILSASALLLVMRPLLAEDQPAGEKSDKGSTKNERKKDAQGKEDDDYDKPTRVLEGGVKGTAIILEEGLARIGLASDLIEESTMKIMKESTRKDNVVVRGPNYIGNGTVIQPVGGIGGVMQFGELPIRRDRLDRFLSETEQNVAALQSYVDALIVPTEKPDAVTAYGEIRTQMQLAQQHLTRLKELSSQKKLANLKIGRAAMGINNAMADINKQRAVLQKASEL